MPNAVIHPTLQELSSFGLGRLPQPAAATIAAHLNACPDCRRAVTTLPRELADHPRYRILRELGRGGMGIVYLAEHTVMSRHVAVKVISRALLEQPGALVRFRAEVRAAAQLDHANIVRAYDAEQVGDLHLLVMEYVEGQSLGQVLRDRGRLPVANACNYAHQAALGLHHAFEKGMTHRDVKPSNLMLTPQGRVKVLDFGVARVAGERRPGHGLTDSRAFMGTVDYVAPEQANDARAADTRADIYSLGSTLYHLLAGRPPFQGETAVQVILAHVEQEADPLPKLRPDVPPVLSAVVARMMAKDPRRRYPTPIEAARALAPFCRADPQTKAPTPAPAPAASAPARKVTVSATGTRPTPPGRRPPAPVSVGGPAGREGPDGEPVRRSQGKGTETLAGGEGVPWPDLGDPPTSDKLRMGLIAVAAVASAGLLVATVLLLQDRGGRPIQGQGNPSPGGVNLVVQNIPSGAVVFLDGQRRPETVPEGGGYMRIPLDKGDHQLKIVQDGYQPFGPVTVHVEPGKPAEPIWVEMKPLRGRLIIRELHPGDKLFVDNEDIPVGRLGPGGEVSVEVEPGSHSLKVTRTGYEDWTPAEVVVKAGESVRRDVAMRVKLEVAQSGRNGGAGGAGGKGPDRELPPPEKPAEPDKPHEPVKPPEPPKRETTGTLVVEVEPADAEVFVAGKKWTPKVSGTVGTVEVLLEEGRPYDLKVKREGYKEEKRAVKVEGGQSEKVPITLRSWVEIHSARWKWDFDPKAIVAQLMAVDAKVAYPDPNGGHRVTTDGLRALRRGKAMDTKPIELKDVKLIHFTETKPESRRLLAQALKLEPVPEHFVIFFPERWERRLLELELADEKGRPKYKEEEIESTRFTLQWNGEVWQPKVEGHALKQ
jgi:tRNA A-37 threonylcarbamoyl transferase component Bud32